MHNWSNARTSVLLICAFPANFSSSLPILFNHRQWLFFFFFFFTSDLIFGILASCDLLFWLGVKYQVSVSQQCRVSREQSLVYYSGRSERECVRQRQKGVQESKVLTWSYQKSTVQQEIHLLVSSLKRQNKRKVKKKKKKNPSSLFWSVY